MALLTQASFNLRGGLSLARWKTFIPTSPLVKHFIYCLDNIDKTLANHLRVY